MQGSELIREFGREHYAELGWAFIAASVAVIDVCAPPGKTLSEKVDDWIEHHPVATIATVGAVALHLVNAFDHYKLEKYDVIHRLGNLTERRRYGTS